MLYFRCVYSRSRRFHFVVMPPVYCDLAPTQRQKWDCIQNLLQKQEDKPHGSGPDKERDGVCIGRLNLTFKLLTS